MTWINLYEPSDPQAITDLYGPEPYDINFCYPYLRETLENDRVLLTPFLPRVHARLFQDEITAHPELFRYLPFPPFPNVEKLLTEFELIFRRDPRMTLFVVIDKTKPDPAHPEFGGGSFAGMIALVHTSTQNLSAEIGFVVTFPAFQRTHVTTNAIGLLLRYCLQLPSALPPGIGLRRVQWMENARNRPSIRAAERIGMGLEATLKWNWVLPEGMEGKPARNGDPVPNHPGRDSVILAMCWDDWEAGGREGVEKQMARTST